MSKSSAPRRARADAPLAGAGVPEGWIVVFVSALTGCSVILMLAFGGG